MLGQAAIEIRQASKHVVLPVICIGLRSGFEAKVGELILGFQEPKNLAGQRGGVFGVAILRIGLGGGTVPRVCSSTQNAAMRIQWFSLVMSSS